MNIVFSAKSIVDGGPAQNNNYSDSYARHQASEFQLRDTFVQYKKSAWNFKFGYQQIVWGETFGSFYADIVNPKDLRDMAPDNLERVRLPLLLARVDYLFSEGSIQFIYSPLPKFNRISEPDGDFSPFKTIQSTTSAQLQVDADPPSENKPEGGLRIAKLFRSTDVSIFHFNYYDRMPTFKMAYASFTPFTLNLTPEHQNISTSGFTLTHDFEVLLLRLEALLTPKRYFNGYINGQWVTKSASQNISVIELGFPTLETLHLTLQMASDSIRYNSDVSDSAGSSPVDELQMSRRNQLNTFSVDISKTLSNDMTCGLTISNMNHDGSKLIRSKLMIPLNSRLEWNFGFDSFSGDKTDYFGQYRDSSRAWTGFHGYL
jgi:hypothetical protein